MDEQTREPTNLEVVAGAGLAAGAVAGLVVALGRSGDPEPERLPVPPPPATEPAPAMEGARAAVRDLAGRVPEAAAGLQAGARGAAAAGQRAAERLTAVADRDSLTSASAAVGEAAERAVHRARGAVDRAGQKGHEVKRKAEQEAHRVGDQTASTAQTIAAQAAAAAAAGAERARDLGASLGGTVRGRVPDVTHRAAEVVPGLRDKVAHDVAPSVRDVAFQAASTALELWHSARERAAETARTDVKEPAAHAVHAVEARAERAREASAAVASRAAELGERARSIPRRTAVATVDTGKDTGALLFWAGAAGGLVFYALLSPELREQATRAAQAASTQIRELVRDFQGYDDDF